MQHEINEPDEGVYEAPDENRGIAIRSLDSEDSDHRAGLNNFASSVKEVAQKTGEVLNKATESIEKAINSALAARDHVVMVRVNEDSLKRIEELVQSGIFKSRSEAAAFLISEGIKSQTELFGRIESKIGEIERLRAELKGIVQQ
jgi:Arc/MetJ-type ribon-helix-helix transcriptional regulator